MFTSVSAAKLSRRPTGLYLSLAAGLNARATLTKQHQHRCHASKERYAPDLAAKVLRRLAADAAGVLLAACTALQPLSCNAAPPVELPSTDASREQYERAVRRHTPKSQLPTQGEAEVLLQLPRELFTDDAWEGMKTSVATCEVTFPCS